MKRRIILLLLLSITTTSVHSQALIALIFGKKIETDKFKLGLFVGAQDSYITHSGSWTPHLGLVLGAYTDIKLWGDSPWLLQNYIVFKSPKGASNMDMPGNSLSTDSLILADASNVKRDLTYFEISPLMRYFFGPSWSVGLGPMIGFRMIAHDTYETSVNDGNLSYKIKSNDDTNLIDAGVAIDVQYRFMKGKGVQLNFRYTQSFTDLYKDKVLDGKNMFIQFGVGIPIVATTKPKINNQE